MAAVFAFIGMLLLSMVIALLVVLQLGDFFNANAEFILVIAGVAAFVIVAQLIFAAAYAMARKARMLNWVGFALAVLALTPVVLPGLIQKIADRSTNPHSVGVENTYITLELIVPALSAVLVQWGLARRRWLRTAGADDFTLWPWITTGLGALLILNPLGLAMLRDTLRHSPTDILWELTATITAGVLGALLVMVWIECYIRDRALHRRLAANTPPPGGQPKS
jgi:hypothetical protein